MSTPPSDSVLIIGASGRTGVRLIRVAAEQTPPLRIHAFVRSADKLKDDDKEKCASIQIGNATNSDDIATALQSTGSRTAVIAIGSDKIMQPQSIRTDCATAFLTATTASALASTRVIVVSSLGAGGTKINMGLGKGQMLSWMLKHALADHSAQEAAFKAGMTDENGRRKHLLIVRPTGLTEDKSNGGHVQLFEGKQPSNMVDRADVAKWIIGQVCNPTEFGKDVNISAGKPPSS